ncbi:hypothetical protein ACIOD1_12825 [Streptomyces sp. NPDC088097]|uniref:hypothetical protein n=1 Tax=Streptomyces sp. NPDC088097 TaxID=3365823 RepID=UPI00382AF80E
MTNLTRFPKSGFALHCPDGQDFAALPGQFPDGRRTIRFCTGSEDTGHAEAAVPLEQLEEVIAGLREIARRQDGPAPVPRRRLTELEHDRAWHTIEGLDWEATHDPGTVLNAVLRALGIDPPAVPLPGALITAEQLAHARDTLPDGSVISAEAIRLNVGIDPEAFRTVIRRSLRGDPGDPR